MLEVHHIIKRSKLRLDVDWNLCTLCKPCHDATDTTITIEGTPVLYGQGVTGVNANEPLTFPPRTPRWA